MPRKLGLPVLSGVVLALCLPRPGLCPLAWVALAPLLIELARRPSRESFALGWTAGFAFHGVAFYWIYSTCRFALIPIPIALIAWAALAAFQGLLWGLIALAARYGAESLPERLKPWGWAVVWTALSVAAERWTPRLPGDLLGYTQWRNLGLLQMASIFGPHGLGFLIVAVNACLAKAWVESDGARRPAGAAAVNLALALTLTGGAWAYGAACLAQRWSAPSAGSVEVLQPAVDVYEKWDRDRAKDILAKFDTLLSLPRTRNPSLIVWPESALPYWVDAGQSPQEPAAWSRKLGAAQLVGVVSTDRQEQRNSVFLIDGSGKNSGAYHKRELVPFGEFVPLESLLRRFVGKLNELGGFSSGALSQPLLPTPLGPAAVSICYEAVFPKLARHDAARQARLLINVTNDGWYKDTWGPYQHFYVNVFRAVETRLPVIRSGNTGISAVIDPWGAVVSRLDLNARGRLDAEVTVGSFPRGSFYARHGDWFGLLCLGLGILLASRRFYHARR